ncbi:hypothetical protein [Paractinoplanes atraurantiacus]|nr:hypothetical protein [Actinoplanes atraurantiacus]
MSAFSFKPVLNGKKVTLRPFGDDDLPATASIWPSSTTTPAPAWARPC